MLTDTRSATPDCLRDYHSDYNAERVIAIFLTTGSSLPTGNLETLILSKRTSANTRRLTRTVKNNYDKMLDFEFLSIDRCRVRVSFYKYK